MSIVPPVFFACVFLLIGSILIGVDHQSCFTGTFYESVTLDQLHECWKEANKNLYVCPPQPGPYDACPCELHEREEYRITDCGSFITGCCFLGIGCLFLGGGVFMFLCERVEKKLERDRENERERNRVRDIDRENERERERERVRRIGEKRIEEIRIEKEKITKPEEDDLPIYDEIKK